MKARLLLLSLGRESSQHVSLVVVSTTSESTFKFGSRGRGASRSMIVLWMSLYCAVCKYKFADKYLRVRHETQAFTACKRVLDERAREAAPAASQSTDDWAGEGFDFSEPEMPGVPVLPAVAEGRDLARVILDLDQMRANIEELCALAASNAATVEDVNEASDSERSSGSDSEIGSDDEQLSDDEAVDADLTNALYRALKDAVSCRAQVCCSVIVCFRT